MAKAGGKLRSDDVEGVYALGMCARHGWEIAADPRRAKVLLTHACKLGVPAACVTGALRALGKGDRRALAQLEAACKADDAQACRHLGLLQWRQAERHQGRGDDGAFETTSAKAVALLTRACKLCSAKGCHEVASIRQAIAANKGTVAAATGELDALYRRACVLGYRPACADQPAPSKGR